MRDLALVEHSLEPYNLICKHNEGIPVKVTYTITITMHVTAEPVCIFVLNLFVYLILSSLYDCHLLG